MYNIIRRFYRGGKRVIKSGLTFEEALQHCKDPETSSRTCTCSEAVKYTEINGPWFDSFEECKKSRAEV